MREGTLAAAQKTDALHMLAFVQAAKHCGSVLTTTHQEGINGVALAGVANVGGHPAGLVLGEALDFDPRIAFAKGFPGARTVYAIAADLEPGSQLVEYELGFFVNGAIRPLKDVEEHGSVLRRDVDDHINDLIGVLIDLADIVEPIADAGIRLPREFLNALKLALFNIENAGAVHLDIAVLLRIHGTVFPVPLNGCIVQMSDDLQSVRIILVSRFRFIVQAERQSAVGIQKVRLVLRDQFLHTRVPVGVVLLVGGIPRI